MSTLTLKKVIELADEGLNCKSILGFERIERKYRLTFYIDERTKRIDGKYIVKPMGKSCNGYYYVCCPHCQKLEAVHKDEIKRGKLIKSRCSNNSSNIPNRILPVHDKDTGETKLIKIKQDAYYIDLEGWCE